MRLFVTFIFLGFGVLLCGCSKHHVLMDECAKVEAEKVNLLVEMRGVDAQLQSLDSLSSSTRLLGKAEARQKEVAALQAVADKARLKWASIGQALDKLNARAEVYKSTTN